MLTVNDTVRTRASETVNALLRKVYRVIDDADDEERSLTCEDVDCLLSCWKTIHLALDAAK